MNTVLSDLIGCICFIYIDDIVVYSSNEHTYLQHLQKVLSRLEQAGLALNMKKCKIRQQSLTFLGHVITAQGICTEEKKVEAIHNYSTPTAGKELQRFLGLTGLYHYFIPHYIK